MAPLAAAEIDREIGGDTIEPGRKARTRFELGEVLVGANEGFLSQLNSIILVVHDRLCDADHAPLVALNQGAESLRVTIPRQLKQFGFVGFGAQCSTQRVRR